MELSGMRLNASARDETAQTREGESGMTRSNHVWECARNFAVNVKLAPGGAYTNQMERLVPQPTEQKKLSFRMGFTPLESTNTFWSNEVTIKVE